MNLASIQRAYPLFPFQRQQTASPGQLSLPTEFTLITGRRRMIYRVRVRMISETAVRERQERKKYIFNNGLRLVYLIAKQFQMGENAVAEKSLPIADLNRIAGHSGVF